MQRKTEIPYQPDEDTRRICCDQYNSYHTSENYLYFIPLRFHKFSWNYCKYICIDGVTERSNIFLSKAQVLISYPWNDRCYFGQKTEIRRLSTMIGVSKTIVRKRLTRQLSTYRNYMYKERGIQVIMSSWLVGYRCLKLPTHEVMTPTFFLNRLWFLPLRNNKRNLVHKE